MELEHRQRRRWCQEISNIHKIINPSGKHQEKNIFAIE